MNEINLKPCPYCGGTQAYCTSEQFTADSGAVVRCPDCGAITREYAPHHLAEDAKRLLLEYYLELTGRLAPSGYYNPGDYENPPEMEYDRIDTLLLFFDVPYEVIQTIEEQAEAYNKAHRVELTEDDVPF